MDWLTKPLANERASRRINVNAIAPNYIATNNLQTLHGDPERSYAILDRIPAGHWSVPEDIAGTAVFFAPPAADYNFGAVINVDGGWLARCDMRDPWADGGAIPTAPAHVFSVRQIGGRCDLLVESHHPPFPPRQIGRIGKKLCA